MSSTNFTEVWDSTFHWWSHNSSYAIPGLYDNDIADAAWVLTCGLLFFTLQTGFALIEVGVCNKKNHANVLFKNVADVAFGGLLFYIYGYGLAYGRGEYTNPFLGLGDFFIDPPTSDPLAKQIHSFYMYQVAFSSTSACIMSGAIAERPKFTAYLCMSIATTSIYCIMAGWFWGQHGWLKNIGVLDFAGSGPIHITGGAMALWAVIYIGPRIGRFDKGTRPIPPSSNLAMLIGLLILWWGWIAFNAGSSYGLTGGRWDLAARAGVGTAMSAMSAGAFSMLYSMFLYKGKADTMSLVGSMICSLVSINAGCYVFPTYISVLVGALASLFSMTMAPIVEHLRIDDACGSISVHLVGGVWGQIAVGLFANPATGRKGLFMGGGWYMLIIHCISVVAVFTVSSILSLIAIWSIDMTIGLRMSPEDEIRGSDLSEHIIEDEPVKEVERVVQSVNQVFSITGTPITHRFKGSMPRADNMERRQSYHTNIAFENSENNLHWTAK